MVVFFFDASWSKYAAIVVFVIASATDMLDGYIARKYDQTTDFGKFADPLADKLLMTAVFVGLSAEGVMPAWIVIVVIARELIVTGLRSVAALSGKVVAASWFGKVKTVTQMVFVLYLIPFGGMRLSFGIIDVNLALSWIILIVTAASGIDYLYKNRTLLKMSK